MPETLTVTQLVATINELLSAFGDMAVEGEIDDYKIIQNKWVAFSLKDEQSVVNCFMTVWQLHTALTNGMMVRLLGRPKLRPKGFFSFVVSDVVPTGEGALKQAFELLKRRLETEGLFAPERHRALPRFPRHIALITSKDAAAYSDFLKVLKTRQGGLKISFLHTQVQGDNAPAQIASTLEYANTHLENLDAIVLVRGGGSLEDLQAFNDERVVRAVAASRTPIIVGVGHERDLTLAELAADLRASTPSNAAELLVRSRTELQSNLEYLAARLRHRLREDLASRSQKIDRQVHMLRGLTQTYQERLRKIQTSLVNEFNSALRERQTSVAHMNRLLQSLSPQNVLKRGFSITRDERGQVIISAQQTGVGNIIETTLRNGIIKSRVE